MIDRIRNETDLIQTYLAPLAHGMPGAFGLGDDAALLSLEAGIDLVISTDPIIAGVHFFPTDRADDIAWKALAVNVSDQAAKGAEPLAYTMALAFPAAPERAWMSAFCDGLASAQAAFGCRLIGGDTDHTPGPLSIGVTAFGTVPRGAFVARRGARAGDHVFVTGTIGDAALGLALQRYPGLHAEALTAGDRSFLIGRYLRPNPRLALTAVLRAHASAALDVSDGLVKDLARLAGGLGLSMALSDVPLSPPARAVVAIDHRALASVLSGGDDYEILVAVAASQVAAFRHAVLLTGVSATELGVLQPQPGIRIFDDEGGILGLEQTGYDHFQGS